MSQLSFRAFDADHHYYEAEDAFIRHDYDALRVCLSPSPIHDTLAALLCHGLFDRFPGLRVATWRRITKTTSSN